MVFTVELLEHDLECVLAATLLQVLETKFRCIGLILDREANVLLRAMMHS